MGRAEQPARQGCAPAGGRHGDATASAWEIYRRVDLGSLSGSALTPRLVSE